MEYYKTFVVISSNTLEGSNAAEYLLGSTFTNYISS